MIDGFRESAKLDRRKVFALSVAFFFLSLVNHWVTPWFAGAGILFIYQQVFYVEIRRRALVEAFVLLTLLVVFALKFVIIDTPNVAPASVAAFSNNFIVYCLLIVIWLLLRSILLGESAWVLRTAIVVLLFMHLFFFYTQFLIYAVTGYYVDFVFPFTGEETRYLGFDRSLGLIGGVRPTGFYVEPSNFAAVIFFLIAILKTMDGLRIDALTVLALASMFFAFSTAGMILGGALLVILLLGGKEYLSARLVFASIVLVLAIVFFDPLFSLYVSQEKKYLSSSEIRFSLLDYVFARDGYAYFIGYGPFGVESSLLSAATDTVGGRIAASLTDSGTLVFLMINFGLLGVVLYGGILARQHHRVRQTAFLLVASLSKLSVFLPIWLLLYLFLLNAKDRFRGGE